MTSPFTDPNRNTLYCSFCDKSQHDVLTLIAGRRVFICDECVDVCAKVVFDRRNDIHDWPQDDKYFLRLCRLLKAYGVGDHHGGW